MPIDLSAASDDGLALILLRVPIKDLIGKCTQVSPQWNRILSESFFWRKKMEYVGYALDWPKLAGISTKSFQWIALKHCFGRNFIKDNWNLDEQNEKCLTLDPRWHATRIAYNGPGLARIEIPPLFLDGEPEIPPGYDKPIPACIAIPQFLSKQIVIKLADEGLTDEIMDNFRPTIIYSEMIGNRRDCSSLYKMYCSLGIGHYLYRVPIGDFFPNEFQREYRIRERNGHQIAETIKLRFKQWQDDEGWHRMEIAFKDYPSEMRYLQLHCLVSGNGNYTFDPDQNGLKLANCSVTALLEKNAE